jgi:hypothetical protein
MVRKQTQLKEWRSGIPPQGEYMLDTGGTRCHVSVEDGQLKWDGKTHEIEFAYKFGKLLGPLPSENTEEEKNMKRKSKEGFLKAPIQDEQPQTPILDEQPQTPVPAAPLLPALPDIDAETDSGIRAALAELAEYSYENPHAKLAGRLVDVYGNEISKVREGKKGWKKIAAVFKRHGLDVGARALRVKAEKL